MTAPALFRGVDEIANHFFQTRSYRHRTLLRSHQQNPPTAKTGSDLTQAIFGQIRLNFKEVLAEAEAGRSIQNWRLVSPGTECDPRNKPREVGLERALVAACEELGRRDWWNQVPVASGLLDGSAGKRRAIDLVHRRGASAYDFVELKLRSDTPVYAAVEILQYGFIWLLSRRAKAQLGYRSPSLLDAEDVGLSVLAPKPFFSDVEYGALGEGIDTAVQQIAQANGVSLNFRFNSFPPPPDFVWTGVGEVHQLCRILDDLYPGNA